MQNNMLARRLIVALVVAALPLVVLGGCSKPKPAAVQAPAPGASEVATPSADASASTDASGSSAAATQVPAPESPGITTTKPKPAAPGTTRPTDADVLVAAANLAKDAGEVETVTSSKVLGVTQDSKGNWWAYVDIKYTAGGNDAEQQFILKQTGKSWDIYANGTGLTYDDMPKDVRF